MCQVDYAFELIDEIHPIEKYPIYVAFPYLKYVTSRCCYGLPYMKPCEEEGSGAMDHDQELSLMHDHSKRKTVTCNGKEVKKRSKKHKKQQLSKETTTANPLAQLGYGIIAYTGMMYYMIWAFAFYSLLLTPVFLFYAGGTAYSGVENQDKLRYAPKTLGALGYSSFECQNIPFEIGQLTISCDYGTISVGALNVDYFSGVSSTDTFGDLCMWNP